ncbi:MAG: tRNA 4-thiouridine(8) synthase ThiI [Eubacteriaceae bacterium]|nr:tRNA 4-thiouridine(8) synthase ThiI [Eubacteriaceae bacterium]
MERIILVRYGEIGLKGLNKSFFIDMLIRNIKNSLTFLRHLKIENIQGRFILRVYEEDVQRTTEALQKVFGIVSVSVACRVNNDMEQISDMALKLMKETVEAHGYTTFKVVARRANKAFPISTPELNQEIGGLILDNMKDLSVDVHDPQAKLYIEVREKTYIFTEILHGKGGLPVGSGGKATLLISGGIDSPVAGYMIAKRGVELIGVHFYSYPYTSERAKEKVIRLMEIVARYSGMIKLYIVPFTDIQLEIGEKCNDKMSTLIMRRYMMKISTIIAKMEKAPGLITGESIGQVASQTLESLLVTDNATDLPVFRPVIGMDKNEIIKIAQEIDTFETSILPYEDCCTVFVPKHPMTRPKLDEIVKEESKIERATELIDIAVKNCEVLEIYAK